MAALASSSLCAGAPGACKRTSKAAAAFRPTTNRQPAAPQGGLRALPLRHRVCASAAALDRPAPTGPSQGAVLVAFEVPACSLAFGEHLRVVGSCAELGGWDAAKAPALGWAAGDNWAAAVAVPPGDHAFKLVIVKQDGSTYWEQGGDRSLAVTAAGPAAASGTPALRATCRFGDTAAIEVEGPAAKLAAGAALQAVPEAEAPTAVQPSATADLLPAAQAAPAKPAEAAATAANGAASQNGASPAPAVADAAAAGAAAAATNGAAKLPLAAEESALGSSARLSLDYSSSDDEERRQRAAELADAWRASRRRTRAGPSTAAPTRAPPSPSKPAPGAAAAPPAAAATPMSTAAKAAAPVPAAPKAAPVPAPAPAVRAAVEAPAVQPAPASPALAADQLTTGASLLPVLLPAAAGFAYVAAVSLGWLPAPGFSLEVPTVQLPAVELPAGAQPSSWAAAASGALSSAQASAASGFAAWREQAAASLAPLQAQSADQLAAAVASAKGGAADTLAAFQRSGSEVLTNVQQNTASLQSAVAARSAEALAAAQSASCEALAAAQASSASAAAAAQEGLSKVSLPALK